VKILSKSTLMQLLKSRTEDSELYARIVSADVPFAAAAGKLRALLQYPKTDTDRLFILI
jgi:hypothetical protein